jgi:hypothetical protein
MSNDQHPIEKVGNDLGKWLFGTISAITAIVSFVNLLRGNFQLGVLIFVVLILANLLAFLLYILLYTKPVSSKSKKRISSYEKYKKAAAAGIVATLLIILGILSSKPNREFITTAVMGTPTATPTTTPTPGPPQVTLVVTIHDGNSCGIYRGEEYLSTNQKSILDVGINNNSDTDLIIKSVFLQPEWIYAGQWLGPISSSEKYQVSVDTWWDQWQQFSGFAYEFTDLPTPTADELKRFKVEEDVIWVKPDPIEVKDIAHDKYTIKKNSQERFQISMGLTDKYKWLLGSIFLEIHMDNNIVLRSEPLEIIVCYEEQK